MKQWLFFADTPLQLYNATLLASSLDRQSAKADLIVYSQFNNSDELIDVYKSLGIFRDVIECPSQHVDTYRGNFLWSVKIALGLKKIDFSQVVRRRYDCFALACPAPANYELLVALRRANKQLSVVMYEDGTGSYNGNVFQQPSYFDVPPIAAPNEFWYTHCLRSLLSLRPFRKVRYDIEALYVKNPSMIQVAPSIPVKKLESRPEAIKKLVKMLMPDMPRIPEKGAVIVLDIPRTNKVSSEEETIDQAIESLIKAGITPLLREHPRSVKRSVWAPRCRDFSQGFWELICQSDPNIEKCTLIGIASTAQLAPLMEANKKPSLLFLYEIAHQNGMEEGIYEQAQAMHRLAEKGYGESKGFVSCPESADEIPATFKQGAHRS